MTDGAPRFDPSSEALDATPGADEGCGHPNARQIRLHLPYAQANVVRVRYAELVDGHVWPLRRAGDAWSFRICRACSAPSARTA